ncbi:head-tail connector protein [Anaeromyxobacter sp. PSR-1]|uniref:head-tail connector protein n=1 Tax=Anaeromyxobacter sp. PSR-1 TaxID=1300915 RepID=UPI000750A7FC|nr:head-tail connector protein [Anaeromyxobacter sp. PSR-1]
MTVVNQLGILSSPSAPFQSIGLVSPPLADVDELKAYLDITHTNDDALITTLIAAASTFVESYTGVDFRYRLKTEIRDGDGGKLMTLRERPVVSIVSVAIDEQSIAESVGLSVDGWYFHDGHLRLRGHRFTLGDGNVQISYTCGYPVVPFDIKQAVIEMAGLKYRDRTRIGKTSESMAGQSVSFLPAVVPLSVLAVLDAYRRIPCL